MSEILGQTDPTILEPKKFEDFITEAKSIDGCM